MDALYFIIDQGITDDAITSEETAAEHVALFAFHCSLTEVNNKTLNHA